MLKIILWLLFASLLSTIANGCLPRRGDVSVSSRWQHIAPVGNPNTSPWLTTNEAEKAFFATRLDWVYTTNSSFVNQSRIPVQASINSNNPDSFDGPATYNVGRILNLYGEKITAPWMANFTPTPYYGCINNPSYRQVVTDRAMRLLQPISKGGVGACSLQHDDPWSNYESTMWSKGGCYCSFCIKKFSSFLAQRGIIPNASSFNYSSYLIAQGGYGKGSTVLRSAFEEFQAGSVQSYLTDLVADLKNVSSGSAVCPCPLAISGNVPAINVSELVRNITSPLDYALTELSAADATPDYLFTHVVHQQSGGGLQDGKYQVFTMPKAGVITSALKVLTRKVAGLLVALGSYMVAPWDVYLPGTPPGYPARFYGNTSDFADLGSFVRTWSALIENCSELAGSWYPIPSSSWKVTIDSSQVFWTVRTWRGASSIVIHMVDWDWGVGINVLYPLPSNLGVVHEITVASLDEASWGVHSVAWLGPEGTMQQLPFNLSGEGGAVLRFNTTTDMLKPWAVVLVQW